jgi:release factor glutamine methyltransferase
VLDVGTGSGCIAVTLAKHHKTARIIAVDASAAALEVAAGNARKHGVADRIAFREGNLFAAVAGETFDAIVSNPPYIAHGEFAALDRGVRDFEPRSALDGGPDGLEFYRRLAAEAPCYLKPGGIFMVEIAATQAAAVRDVLSAHLESGKLFDDPAGRPRVLSARKPAI